MTKGIVYIIQNPEYPHLIKIGMTSNLQKRLSNFNRKTQTPVPFECLKASEVENMKQTEREMHIKFNEYRNKNNKEFFRVECLELAIEMLNKFEIKDVTDTAKQKVKKHKDKIYNESGRFKLSDHNGKPFPKNSKMEKITFDGGVVNGHNWKCAVISILEFYYKLDSDKFDDYVKQSIGLDNYISADKNILIKNRIDKDKKRNSPVQISSSKWYFEKIKKSPDSFKFFISNKETSIFSYFDCYDNVEIEFNKT
ncbi:MAG: GIY-YIG nuclease family protein [Alphaproteobacteria bacterium]